MSATPKGVARITPTATASSSSAGIRHARVEADDDVRPELLTEMSQIGIALQEARSTSPPLAEGTPSPPTVAPPSASSR